MFFPTNDQVAEHDAMFVAQARARQDGGGEAGVLDVDSDTGRDQFGIAGVQCQGVVDAGAQVHAGRTFGGVGGQGDGVADTVIEDLKLYFSHSSSCVDSGRR